MNVRDMRRSSEEGVKRAREWKQKKGGGGAVGVDRLQMCLEDKLKERGVFVL